MEINQISKKEVQVEEKVYSVSEFLNFLNRELIIYQVVVQGEVGENVDYYKERGYIFFNILDNKDKSVLKCFAWKETIEALGVELESGMEIKVFGYPEIRKDRGELKFQVKRIELVGEGILKKQFEILKKKLADLGYFDEENKKPIPKFCKNIGLITSKEGKGAKKDFETNLGKFGFQIFFYDVRVEGSYALTEIIAAINYFNQNYHNFDVLVIVRGGGDWESLKAFNSEEIVKAIRASRIPIITGIGHEKDTTLADLAADLRASTPTDAAKILNKGWEEAKIKIFEIESNLHSRINKLIENFKREIGRFEKDTVESFKKIISTKHKEIGNLLASLNLRFQNYFKKFEILEKEFKQNELKIFNLLKDQERKIEEYQKGLVNNQKEWQKKIDNLLKQQEERLIIANPILKLKQGYTITTDEAGKIIKDIKDLKTSQIIKTRFYKGQVLSKIKKIDKQDEGEKI
jgi:exodeoxyribonuclease VII large subunit